MPSQETMLRAWTLMCQAKAMADIYEQNRNICRYVHSTSAGHEAIQFAAAFHLLPVDFVSPYYRDESMLLGMGYRPYELMLQLLAKKDDPFSGGREYYSHPSSRDPGKPQIIHQSSATGMQVIPTTGIAQGLAFLEKIKSEKFKRGPEGEASIVLCSLGDASITEGEVGEAFQFAVLHQLPIIYLVQDNGWGISVTSDEARVTDACGYAAGFPGLNCVKVDGTDFSESYRVLQEVISKVRTDRKPWLVQAACPLLGHHTSGVRREFYRSEDDLSKHRQQDPWPKLRQRLLEIGLEEEELIRLNEEALKTVRNDFTAATNAPEPETSAITHHVFAATDITEESGNRIGNGSDKIVMVDAALFAIREIMEDHPEAILFGQDVGRRLGGVFREAATLAERFGDHRVFNTAIQEAYIIGSTAGLSAVGVKPIVEIQFGDYIYPGFNQLVTELSKSCYLSNGKYPVQALIRVPVGAYGGGGPYHSGCIETTLLSIKGIKVVYPSNAADMKGLMKAAFHDPNPVVMLEHKGLYWSKVPGTEQAKTPEPARDYIIPLGKGRVVISAEKKFIDKGETCCIITYGMGVYWAMAASKRFPGKVEVIDLRTLFPLDEELIYHTVEQHGKCIILTEEQEQNSFAEALAGRISNTCFRFLDAPVEVLGAMNLPAVPMNIFLEKEMLPDAEKVEKVIEKILSN